MVLKNPGVFASFVTFLKGETFTWMVWKALGVSRSGSQEGLGGS